MNIVFEKADSAAARTLIAGLDADLEARYPGSPIFGIDAAGFEAAGGLFAVGYADGVPVACGALRPWEDAVEVKRMFVVPAARGRGYAKAMMRFLEAEAVARGFDRILLETGSGQPEAIALYRGLGWIEVPPFGIYAIEQGAACPDVPEAFRHVCFEKRVAQACMRPSGTAC